MSLHSTHVSDIVDAANEIAARADLSIEEVDEFVRTSMRDPQSALRTQMSNMDREVQDTLYRSHIHKPKIVVKYDITPDQSKSLRSDYPEFQFEVTAEIPHDHSIAAARRSADRALLRKRLPLGAEFIDVGGDYVYNIMHSHNPIHSDCPSVDAKDLIRTRQRDRTLDAVLERTLDGELKQRIIDYKANPSLWKCDMRSQECNVQAPYLLMSHVYDMTLEQVALAMESHGAFESRGCLLMNSQIVYETQGVLPSVDGWFSVEPAGDIVQYGFNNSESWKYRHSVRELRRFASDTRIVLPGAEYAYVVVEVRGDTLFFSMVKLKKTLQAESPREAMTLPGGPYAIVDGYALNARGTSDYRTALVARQYVYPLTTWKVLLDYAIRQRAAGRLTLEDLARHYKTEVAGTVVNTVRVSGSSRLESSQLAMFFANIAMAACENVVHTADELSGITKAIIDRRIRVEANILTKMYKALRAVVSSPRLAIETTRDVADAHGLLSVLYASLEAEQSKNRLGEQSGIADKCVITWFEDHRRWVRDFPRSNELPGGFFDIVGKSKTLANSDIAGVQPIDASERIVSLSKSLMARNIDYALTMTEMLFSTGRDEPDVAERLILTDLEIKQKQDILNQEFASLKTITALNSDPDLIGALLPLSAANQTSSSSSDMQVSVGDTHGVLSDSGFSDITSAERVELLSPYEERVASLVELGVVLDKGSSIRSYDLSSSNRNLRMRESIKEFVSYTKISDANILNESRKSYAACFRSQMLQRHVVLEQYQHHFNVDFFFVENGIFTKTSVRGALASKITYMAAYVPSGDTIIRIRLDRNRQHEGSLFRLEECSYTGYVLVSDETSIYNGPDIIYSCDKALTQPDVEYTHICHEGVAGCGKTTYIVETAGSHDIILASGRDNTNATRDKRIAFDVSRVAADSHHVSFHTPTTFIRTMDSALIRTPSFSHASRVLHIDEAFQEHAGKISALIFLLRPTMVHTHGDRAQLPAISRVAKFDFCRHMFLYSNWDLYHMVTYRCPADACAAVGEYYGTKIRTASRIKSSFTLDMNKTYEAIPVESNVQYLTLHRDDMKILLKKFKNVRTVGSVQGQTYENVHLIRVQAKSRPLYNDPPTVLVALTRHTKTFKYTAPMSNLDKIEEKIKYVQHHVDVVQRYSNLESAGYPVG